MVVWWLGSIILIILFFAIGVFITYKYDNVELGAYLTLFTSAIFIIILFFNWLASLSKPVETNVKRFYGDKIYIYSLEDNFKVNGTFVLGSGTMNSDLYYYVMIGNDKDGYRVSKYKAENTYIIPEENIQPYYIERHKVYDRFHVNNFLFGGLFKEITPELNKDEVDKKELHLPKNYIKQNYNIDMK